MTRMKHPRVFATLIARRGLVGVIAVSMVAAALTLGSATVASAAAPPAPYFNGFENLGDAITGVTSDTQAMFDVNRVPSGTDSITAASGGYFAEAAFNDGSLSQFTRLGGYSSTFPIGGFTTSIAVYLDMSVANGSNDLRFDWSSAINNTSTPASAPEAHRRDFVFSVGTDPLVANQFIMSASNNAPGWPSNPGRDPFTVSTSGWYIFQDRFYDAGAGVLADELSVRDASNNVLHTWILSDPTDIIGTTVGGNRYGWLVDNGFSTLALDNITRTSGTATLGSCQVAVSGSSPTTYTLLADCTTDQTIVVPQNTGGSVFDGNGHSITGVDPTGLHFLGAVVQAASGTDFINVENLTVKVSNLTDACDAGVDRLRGILFDTVGGAITNNTVTDIEQGATGTSGCQEGNAIEARNAPFTKGGSKLNVEISGNTVTDYQKTGILVNGSVAATVFNNVVEGDGPITYIAQNGVQIGFGATAKLDGNDVSLNNYSPPKVTACGLLIYKAGGVSSTSGNGISNVKADNDFHNNEKNLCNFGKGGSFSPTS